MIRQREHAISMEELVTELVNRAGIVTDDSDGIRYGYDHGWIEEQDLLNRNQPVQKKHCARIIHEFLRHERMEPDEIDSGPAGKLQDLFDCRVCAGHVMQVYVKGIMEGYRNADGRYIFGMEDYVLETVAGEIIQRIFQREKRVPKSVDPRKQVQARAVSFQDATLFLKTEKNTLLVDVRPEAEYRERHLNGAIHCPMMDILKNPYAVSDRRDAHILLYCEKGYMSETAAQSLVQAGYENVSYFAWNFNG